MSAWTYITWSTPPPRVRRMRDPLEPITFANHIRGRVTGPVRYAGHPIWRVEVIHVPTGRTLNSDDAFSLSDAYASAAARTHVARLAWFYGFAKEGMKK